MDLQHCFAISGVRVGVEVWRCCFGFRSGIANWMTELDGGIGFRELELRIESAN